MEKEAKLIEELYSYPSYLTARKDLETISTSRQKLQQVMNRISAELDTYDTHMETVRDYNLFALIYFELGEKAEASEFIEKSLLISQKNINALTLKAWFAIKSSNVYNCETLMSVIRKLKEDTKEMLVARAEVAYLYTRFGPKLYSKAEGAFEGVLEEIDHKSIEVDPNVVAIWKFGSTLVVRRTLNFNNLFEGNDFDFTMNKVVRVFRNYQSILRAKQVNTKYKARSMVELGGLLDNPHLKNIQKGQENHDIPDIFQQSADYYFNQALRYSDSDCFVLEKCGRHFRYTRNLQQIDKAISLLEKSLSIKETSFAHHHLGLALKRRLEIRQWSSKTRHSKGQRYNSTRSGPQRRLYTNPHSAISYPNQYRPTLPSNTDSGYLRQNQTTAFGSVMQESHDNYGQVSSHFGAAGGIHSPVEYLPESLVSSFGSMHISRGSYSDMKYRQTRLRPKTEHPNYNNVPGKPVAGPNTGGSIKTSNHEEKVQFHELSKSQLKLKNFIKSPEKITYLDCSNETEVQTILDHLNKSFAMNENMSALYDKGLTLRALRRYDEALSVFKQCFGRGNLTLVYHANSYEQAALCIIDKLQEQQDADKDEDLILQLNYNLQHYLNVCIEISCKKILPFISDIGHCWSSFRILKDRLMTEQRSKENLKTLAELHSKVEQYSEANTFFKKLLEMENKEEDQEEVVRKMVRNYCKLSDYDQAILMTDLMPQRMADAALRIHILVQGGFQAYANKEFEIAKMRLKRAVSQDLVLRDTHAEDDESPEWFDIFVLCSDNVAESSYCIKAGLENVGLDITINFDDLSLFDSKSDGVVKVMKKSTHFVAFVDFGTSSEDMNEMKHYIEIMRNIRCERNYGKTLFIRRTESSPIPICYAHEPIIDYSSDIDNYKTGEMLTDNKLAWLKQLIELITDK